MGFEFKNLIKNECFPSELPPCFYTDTVVENADKIRGWITGVKAEYSTPLTFSGFKNINSRRTFAVPNLYHYFKTVGCIVNNSDNIMNIMELSTISLSKPINKKIPVDMPYSKNTYTVAQTKYIVEQLYQDNNYRIKLDINSFFDSIYTHTIQWAMHTKSIAKKSKGKTLLIGDKIDECVRAMNSNQTNGILTGNAVSRIVSEIILCTIDKKIQEKFKDIKISRFVDDYTIFLKDSAQIPNVISYIRNQLSEYQLMLNENKIEINEGPFIYDKPWVEEIKLFIHTGSELFLTKAINLYQKYKDISILKYCLAVLTAHNFNSNWKVMESRILNLWVKFPSLSKLIIEILINNKNILNKRNIKNAIYTVLDTCIQLNYQQEVIWAVWFAKVFNIKLNQDYVKKIIESRNALAIIILLDIINNSDDYKSKSITVTLKELIKYLQSENQKEILGDRQYLMWSENWLLAYEADLNNWLNIDNVIFEFARNDSFYKNLIKNKIRFYNKNYEYSNKSKNNNNYRKEYISREEFTKYIRKIEELLCNITPFYKINIDELDESKNANEKILVETKTLSEEIINEIENKAFSY